MPATTTPTPAKRRHILPRPLPDKAADAARVLQRAWRHYPPTALLVRRVRAVRLTADHVKSIGFDALVLLLREPSVIQRARACLQRLHVLAALRHGSPPPSVVNARVFLSAYMIAFRPTNVFESMGALEQALYASATPLLLTFEAIGDALLRWDGAFARVPHALTRDFAPQLSAYLLRFKAWRVPDTARLTLRLKQALRDMYRAEANLPPSEPHDSPLKVEFRMQIERLRAKLQQIAGADALRQFDAEPPPADAAATTTTTTTAATAATASRLRNEDLAHALLLDPTFQLSDYENEAQEEEEALVMDRVWDQLRSEDPAIAAATRAALLQQVKEGLMEVAGPREAGNVEELFLLAPAIDVPALVAVIQRVQAPKRDEETAAKWAATPRDDARAVLQFLLDRVHILRVDAANTRLRLIGPTIRDHGIDYERGKFQDRLNDGTLSLHRTTGWIRAVLHAEPELRWLDGSPAGFARLHAAAVLRLLSGTMDLSLGLAPETLLLDVRALTYLQREFRYQVAAISMLLTLLHTLPTTKRAAVLPIQMLASTPSHRLEEAIACCCAVAEPQWATVLLRECATTTSNALHRLTAVRMRALWLAIVEAGGVLPQAARNDPHFAFLFHTVASALVPRIEQETRKLTPIILLNRTVHLPTYNQLLLEESKREHPASE